MLPVMKNKSSQALVLCPIKSQFLPSKSMSLNNES